jgi:hypothetical protein
MLNRTLDGAAGSRTRDIGMCQFVPILVDNRFGRKTAFEEPGSLVMFGCRREISLLDSRTHVGILELIPILVDFDRGCR